MASHLAVPSVFALPLSRVFLPLFLVLALLGSETRLDAQTISVTDLSSSFNAVVTAGGTIMTDPFGDQQTGLKQADIMSFTAGTTIFVNGSTTSTVASADVAGLFVKSGQIANDATNTYLMFRMRFSDSNQAKTYQGSYNMLGLDLTGDGKPDIIFGANSSNATASLDFLKPGTGANDAPNTTTSAAYTTTATTTLNTTGSGVPITFAYAAAPESYDTVAKSKAQNMNLTFAISYTNLQQAIRDMGVVNGTDFSAFVVNSSTAMNFLAFTTQQDNAFNQDIFGGAITSSATASWTSLGAFSTTFSADGQVRPVPELSTIAQTGLLLSVGGIGLLAARRRRALPAVSPSATATARPSIGPVSGA